MPSDRPQLGWRVDPETKKAFQRYVDSLPGSDHGRYGRHLERAMREYIEEDRLANLQEQLTLIADNLGVEKVGKSNPAMADGRYAAPKGKNPGDVRRRTEAITDALLDYAEEEKIPTDEYGPFVTRKIVTDTIEQVGDVHSRKTIQKYLERVLERSMFKRHPDRAEAWVVAVNKSRAYPSGNWINNTSNISLLSKSLIFGGLLANLYKVRHLVNAS